MAIEVKKKENESPASMLFQFTRRIKRGGLSKETRKRLFRGRSANRNKRRLSAIHRAKKKAEYERLKKLGLV